MHVSAHAQIEPFITLDGSQIREWAGPGAHHKLFNVGGVPLRVIRACAPAYSDEDTCLTE